MKKELKISVKNLLPLQLEHRELQLPQYQRFIERHATDEFQCHCTQPPINMISVNHHGVYHLRTKPKQPLHHPDCYYFINLPSYKTYCESLIKALKRSRSVKQALLDNDQPNFRLSARVLAGPEVHDGICIFEVKRIERQKGVLLARPSSPSKLSVQISHSVMKDKSIPYYPYKDDCQLVMIGLIRKEQGQLHMEIPHLIQQPIDEPILF